MKKLIPFLFFAIGSCQSILPSGDLEGLTPCDNALPKGWVAIGDTIHMNQCTGYTIDEGTELPYSGHHTYAVTAYDRTRPSYRSFIGCKFFPALHKGDVVYIGFLTSKAENCQYATDGLGVKFGNGTWPTGYPACHEDGADFAMPVPMIADTGWTFFGGYHTMTDDADRLLFGNFNCDDSMYLLQDVEKSIKSAVYFVDNIEVHIVSLGTEDGTQQARKVTSETDILGRPWNGQGLKITTFEDGTSTKTWLYR